jgi:fucose permease
VRQRRLTRPQQAHANAYVGNLDARAKMSVLHATYGVGALCAPLLATWFAPRAHWSFHYIVSTALSLLNVASVLGVYRLRTLNGPCARARGVAVGAG